MENVPVIKHKGQPNEVLRRERLLRGWSLRDIADRISCPDSRLVRRWENGDIFPGPTYRQRLCELFAKNAEELGLIPGQQTKSPADGERTLSLVVRENIPSPLEPTMLMGEEPAVCQSPLAESALEEPGTTIDRNRQHMLARVRHTWIVGLLEQSLQSATLIPLALYEDTSLVENPWRDSVQEMDHPPKLLPDATCITQVYDAAHGALLILGEPGAGKTTTLLTLAADLLQRAQCDALLPIPVIFHLSCWPARKLPLERWLIEELVTKYQVPYRIGQAWVEQNKLLLLFDGLDEVDPAACEDCIVAINTYRKEHGIVPLVVCSRNTEYLAQKKHLLLHTAVVIQPLTTQQIDAYLEQDGEQYQALRMLFASDTELQELAKTPLLLDILTRTYQGVDKDTSRSPEEGARRDHLFHAYTQRMFERRTVQQKYSKEQTLHWLCWLAKRMKQRSQSVFSVESLQFNDLTESAWARLLPTLTFGLISAAACWITYGLFFQLQQRLSNPWAQSSLVGLLVLLCYIAVNSFIREKVSWFDVDPSTGLGWVYQLKRLSRLLVYGLSMGFPAGLLVGFLMWRGYGYASGLAHGLYGVGELTIDTMLLGMLPRAIQPVELLVFSWRNLRKRLLYCIAGGLVIGLVFWIFFLYEFEPLRALLLGLLLGVVFFCLLSGSVGLVSPKILDMRYRLLPNEGIHRSVRNSLVLGVTSACVQGVLSGLVFSLLGHRSTALVVYGIIPGIAMLNVITTRTGGYAWIQHYVLRFCLWQQDVAPWNYPAFLEYAVERIFLRRVGGGYIFIHRLLLDHFANLDV